MGSADDRNNHRPVGILDRIADALDNRLIMLIAASVIGGSGGLALVKSEPSIRADPFTGSMGAALERRVRHLEQVQALDDQHRIKAIEGYSRIRELEKSCVQCKTRLWSLEQATLQNQTEISQ